MDKAELRLLLVWGGIIALTLMSWEIVGVPETVATVPMGAIAILVLAFVKVRLVVLDLMEIRNAPLPLRLLLEGWIAGVCVAMIAMS